MFGWLASGLEKIAETAERPDNISRRGLFKIGGALAAVGLLNTYCGGDSDGGGNGGGNGTPNNPPVITNIEFYAAKEGELLSAGAVGSDPEGKPIKFYKINCSLDDPQYGGLQVLVAEDGTIYTNDPLPYNAEGVQQIKIKAVDPAGKEGVYEKVFNVEHTLGPNDLPYEFDSTEYAEPPTAIAGIDKVGWENIYIGNADVQALFDSDANNDMDRTMANLIDTNPDNWEFYNDPVIGYSNLIVLTQDTIYYRVVNPETSQVEWKGENIGTAGVNLILSK